MVHLLCLELSKEKIEEGLSDRAPVLCASVGWFWEMAVVDSYSKWIKNCSLSPSFSSTSQIKFLQKSWKAVQQQVI